VVRRPGPASPPDIEEVGVLSIATKLMGVPGPKLLDDERFTQDFMGISAPTFTTPDVRENAKLQAASLKSPPLFYFINPFDSHLLDGIMQGLWARTQTSPFETAYWGCVPYLLGEGRAVQYSFRPRLQPRAACPAAAPQITARQWRRPFAAGRRVRLPGAAPHAHNADRARGALARGLSRPVPTLRLPRQRLATARSPSPTTCPSIPGTRARAPPLNQNRARRRLEPPGPAIHERHSHREPTGDEVFEPVADGRLRSW
jgi:hypothetical protein